MSNIKHDMAIHKIIMTLKYGIFNFKLSNTR
jgi:hypothetical protein